MDAERVRLEVPNDTDWACWVRRANQYATRTLAVEQKRKSTKAILEKTEEKENRKALNVERDMAAMLKAMALKERRLRLEREAEKARKAGK